MKMTSGLFALILAAALAVSFAFCQIAEANLAAAMDDADYGPGYAALDEGQKALYRALEDACEGDRMVSVFPGTPLILDREGREMREGAAVAAYQADHPGEVRLDSVWTTGLPGFFTLVYPTYLDQVTEDQEAQTLAVGEALCASLEGLTQREQVTELYRYLTSTVTYEAADGADHTMYAALVDRRACCQGVAYAMNWCMDRLGIECRVISGEIDEGGHAWNAVKLDGVWYELDATWDLGVAQEEWRWFLVDRAHTLLEGKGTGVDCPTQSGREAA